MLPKRILSAFLLAAGLCTGPSALAISDYRPGQAVRVMWQGGWYDATVVEIGSGRHAGSYRIHYVGYGDNWEEYVTADRIAAPQGSAKPAASAANADAGSSDGPLGRYVCQAFEAGQLHNQGEFELLAGGRYRDLWNRSEGRWKHDAAGGTLDFTGGPLANGAEARLVTTPQGKTAVEFRWGPDVKRWCYRQRS